MIAAGQALSNDHIWHHLFLDGMVESDAIFSMSTLAHIHDNVKVKTLGTSPSIGSAKRGPLVLHRARNARIRFKQQIDFLCPLQLRGRRPTRQSRSARGVSSTPSTAPMPRSPVRPLQSTALCMTRGTMPAPAHAVRAAVSAGHAAGVVTGSR